MLGFPLPYPDELLYSTIARHRVHSGLSSPKELLLEVFGDTKIIATSDLPGHIGTIASLYPESLNIAPIQLLYKHTLFPLYAPFIGEGRRKSLAQELLSNTKSTIHLTAGVAASRLKQPRYLRYCPQCFALQQRKYGECYWQRQWQVAGAEVCPVHGALLCSQIGRHSEHRHEFVPASTLPFITAYQRSSTWQEQLIARNINVLLNTEPHSSPELEQWGMWHRQLAYRNKLTRKTFVSHEAIRERVINFWGSEWLSQYGLLPDGSDSCWLRNIFRKHRKAFSYLEHLVVWNSMLEPGWSVPDILIKAQSCQPIHINVVNHLITIPAPEQIQKYRDKWQQALKQFSVKQARYGEFGDIYAWLYKHDHDWLITENTQSRHPAPPKRPKVNWCKRDVSTVRKLLRICDEVDVKLDDPRHSKNWYMNQLPHKSSVDKHLDQLPLCRLFFERYCENITHHQIRRITRTAIYLNKNDEPVRRWQLLRLSGLSEERLTPLAAHFIREVVEVWQEVPVSMDSRTIPG